MPSSFLFATRAVRGVFGAIEEKALAAFELPAATRLLHSRSCESSMAADAHRFAQQKVDGVDIGCWSQGYRRMRRSAVMSEGQKTQSKQ